MNTKVIIEILTTQRVDEQEDVSWVKYQGECSVKDNVAVLTYRTEEQNGWVETILTLKGAGCYMENRGAVTRTMDFIPGKKTLTTLMLPMGRLELGVVTHRYELQVDKERPDCMQVLLVYDLYQQENRMAENKLEMRIRPL